MAAHPQGGRGAQAGWDAEDHPQSVKTGRTNDEVKADRDALWVGEAPAATAEIDLGRRGGGAAARRASSRCSRPWPRSRSATRTGCSRSSGTAIASRRSSTTARSGSGPATSTTPRPTSRGCSRPPTLDRGRAGDRRWRGRGPRRRRPPGLRPAPDEARRQDGATGLVYQAFDLLYLDGRSLLDVPLEDRKRLLRSVLRSTRGSASRPTSRGRAWRSTRRHGAAGSKGSSPSSGARGTSPAVGRPPG